MSSMCMETIGGRAEKVLLAGRSSLETVDIVVLSPLTTAVDGTREARGRSTIDGFPIPSPMHLGLHKSLSSVSSQIDLTAMTRGRGLSPLKKSHVVITRPTIPPVRSSSLLKSAPIVREGLLVDLQDQFPL